MMNKKRNLLEGWNWLGVPAVYAVVLLASAPHKVPASNWVSGDGGWNDTTALTGSFGWDTASPPDGVGAVATKDDGFAAITTQNSGFSRTLGTIGLGGSSEITWTVNAQDGILLDQDGASAGAATISNTNSSTGPGNALVVSGPITLADDLLITNSGASTNSTGAIQLTDVIAGTGNVTFRNEVTATAGANEGFIRLTSTGINTFLGNVLIQKGITWISNNNSLGDSSNTVTIGDASGGGQGSAALLLQTSGISNFANPIVAVSGTNGPLYLGSTTTGANTASGTILLTDSATNLNIVSASTSSNGFTLSGTISGDGSLTMPATLPTTVANNRIRISGANTFTGGTTVSGGVVIINKGCDSAAPNSFTSGPFGTGTLTLNGGTISVATATGPHTIANPIDVTGSTVFLGGGGTTFPTYTGPVTGSGTLNTQPTGSSNIHFRGDISGFAGTFRIAGSTSTNRFIFSGLTPESTDGSNAKFVNDGTGTNAQWRLGTNGQYSNPTLKMGSLSGTNTGHAINPNGQIGHITLEIGHLGLNDDFQGAVTCLSGSILDIKKVGSGTLSFGSATPTNTYSGSYFTGTVDISNGTFKPGNSTGLGFNTHFSLQDNAYRTNAFSSASPTTQTGNAGTNISGTGTLDLNGLTFNEVITLNSNGIGGIGGLINSNTSSPATVDSGVAFLQINSGGSGYDGTAPPTVSISGGGGSGADVVAQTTGTATSLALGLTTASVTSVSGGANFTVGDVLALTGDNSGTAALIQVTSVGGSGDITGVDIIDSGNGFTSSSSISGATISSSANSSADASSFFMTINSSNFIVSSLKLTAQGSGYTSAPTISITGGGASTDATATALLSEVKLLGDSSIGGDGDLIINAIVSGSGDLTKVGAGSATLTGANTYTGDTTVSGGTLSLSQATLANAADVLLNTGGLLNLNFVGADVIDSLFINGLGQATGVWGALGSGAAHESAFITGTGLLNVMTAAGGVPGDYNGNGVVDSADYVLWRKGGTLQNEVVTIGSNTPEDYTEWRARFGNTSGSGSSLGGGAAVPEPTCVAMIATLALGLACSARRGVRGQV